ncbi:MAG: metallophosphoesterase [Clostridia bacterium]
MLKILQTADFHIGTGFSSFDENLQKKAENMQFQAITAMIDYANAHEIDAILIAGDIFDSQTVDYELRTKLFSIFSKFDKNIYIVCGNHDFYFEHSFWDQTELPENCHLTKTNTWEVTHEEKFTLFSASFTNIYENIDLTEISVEADKINIGLVHADILHDSQYNAITQKDIKNSYLNYLAVGHNHKYSEILKAFDTHYACSGNISATGFDEAFENGFIVATFDSGLTSFEFIKSEGLRILHHEIDITSMTNTSKIKSEILNLAHKNVYLKLSLVGIDNMNLDVNSLQFKDEFFAVNITNTTDKPEDLWRFINDDNLIGEFTRLMRIEYDKDENTREILNALKLGIDSLIV